MTEKTLEEELADVEFLPEPEEDVIMFQKSFKESKRTYTYAGVKIRGKWYLTGAASPQGMDWRNLCIWLHDTGPFPETIQAVTAFRTL